MIEFSKLKKKQRSEICELNKELVSNWFKHPYSKEKRKQATWDDLSPRERFLHGGPWNDLDTLTIHLENFEKFGNIVVAIDTDEMNIIAELEYHFSDNFAHIDWMTVSPKYQHKGIGTNLIKYLCKTIFEDGYNEIITEPESGIENFYISNGFNVYPPELIQSIRVGDGLDSICWKIGMPNNIGRIYGDAANTREYTIFLLQTEREYAKIFKQPNPISWVKLEDDIIVIRRKIAAMDIKFALMLTAINDITEDKIFDVFNICSKNLPKKESNYVALSKHIPNWILKNKILRLRKQIKHII